jgi:hypothetical protein
MLNTDARQFLIKIAIFTAIIAALSVLVFTAVLPAYYPAGFPLAIMFVATITAAMHLRLMKISFQNMRRFSTHFMASVSIKLFSYLIFLLVYLLLNRSEVIPFALTFLFLYICYTAFEVTELLKFLKKQKS